MVIDTQRLLLRPIKQSDILDFYEIFNSDKVDKFVRKLEFEQVQNYFKNKIIKSPNPYNFAVILKENNKMIGNCEIKIKDNQFIATLSYVFNDKYWNKGFCSEACQNLITYIFENTNIHTIIADCNSKNYASIKILKDKLKMQKVKTIKNYMQDEKTKEFINFDFFTLTKKEYCKN